MIELIVLGWYGFGFVAGGIALYHGNDPLLSVLAATLGPLGLAIVVMKVLS